MHELAQLPPLLKKIHELRGMNGAKKVLRASIQVGPFFPLSPEILKIHLVEAVKGSDLENIEWTIKETAGLELPGPADLMLESVELSE